MEWIPESLETLMIITCGIIPGALGDYIFGLIAGQSWREKNPTRLLRIISFSVAGLVLYSILAGISTFPIPIHVLPSTFSAENFIASEIPVVSEGYFGHLIGSALTGVLAAYGVKFLRKNATSTSIHEDSWNEFVKSYVKERWILVTLANGKSYAGMLQQADSEREPEYRDIVLCEPACYDEKEENYISEGLQYLYIQGDQIATIAAYSDPEQDKERVSIIGNPLFTKEIAE